MHGIDEGATPEDAPREVAVTPERESQQLSSVDNALRMLLVVAEHGPIGVTQSARMLGISSSAAQRLLATMELRGFVVQESDRRYAAGPSMLLTFPDHERVNLLRVAQPAMAEFSAKHGGVTHLSVLRGLEVKFVEVTADPHNPDAPVDLGHTLPAMKTAAGKVLLANIPRRSVERRLSAAHAQSEERLKVLRELELVRRRGYGINLEESDPGYTAVGVCVRRGSHPVASISNLFPTAELNRRGFDDVVLRLKSLARAIETHL